MREELMRGDFELSFPEGLIAFTAAKQYWDQASYLSEGDQDYEEFFLNFELDGVHFTLNCALRTEELMNQNDILHYTYTLRVDDCYLKNLDSGLQSYFPVYKKSTFTRSSPY